MQASVQADAAHPGRSADALGAPTSAESSAPGPHLEQYTKGQLVEFLRARGVVGKQQWSKETLLLKAQLAALRPTAPTAATDAAAVAAPTDGMVEAHRWAHKALHCAKQLVHAGKLHTDAVFWTPVEVSVGTCFSGIGTPEWAIQYLAAASRLVDKGDTQVTFKQCCATDAEPLCRQATSCINCTSLQLLL
jgi:hypothetical protein